MPAPCKGGVRDLNLGSQAFTSLSTHVLRHPLHYLANWGGLEGNGLHRLICVNAWVPVGGTCLGRCAFVGGSVSMGQVLRFLKSITILLFLVLEPRCELSVTVLEPYLTCLLPFPPPPLCWPWTLALWNCEPQTKCFLLKVALGTVS